jgi:hypothetical protein
MNGYLSRTRPVDLSSIDFSAPELSNLSTLELRCITYMHDIEMHTACYLRDALATSAHRDAVITEFLVGWAFEETHHGLALARVLDANGVMSEVRIADLRTRLRRRDQWHHLAFTGLTACGLDFYPLHMAVGALNEFTAQASYLRLADVTAVEPLQQLLRLLAQQEGRHAAFYVHTARELLSASNSQRSFVRWALSNRWRPVGSGVVPDSEMRKMSQELFSGPSGEQAVQAVDTRIGRLPGLDGSRPLAQSLKRLRV